MKFDPADLRHQYAGFSDEALLEMNREDLVEAARQIYDEELASRGLVSTEVLPHVDAAAPSDSDEELVEVATYTSREEATMAQSFLRSAEIPCELQSKSALEESDIRLLVRASLLDEALNVLGAEISEEDLAAQAEAAGEKEIN
jgi:hypothetical protein